MVEWMGERVMCSMEDGLPPLISDGHDFYYSEDFEEAIECFREQYEIKCCYDWDTRDFIYWGNALYKLAKINQDETLFKDAIDKYGMAAKLILKSNRPKDEYLELLIHWGNALCELAKIKQNEALFKKAIDKYRKVKNTWSLIYWGNALCELAKIKQNETLFKRAIDKYRKAKRNTWSLICWGNALCELAKIKLNKSLYKEAETLFKKAFDEYKQKQVIKSGLDSTSFIKLGVAFANLARIKQDEELSEKATECFKNAKCDILKILDNMEEKDIKNIEKNIFYPLLSDTNTIDGNFFQKTIENIPSNELDKYNEIYKEIYIYSIFIIRQLRVDFKYEKFVAHYTKAEVLNKMLSKDEDKDENKNFCLNAIRNSNDPTEGEVLLDYLFDKDGSKENCSIMKSSNTIYRAFASCFSFNCNSLNQFRLYGKEMEQEGTGLSLVFCNKFFSKESRMPIYQNDNKKEKWSEDDDEDKKYTLFRCVYIDPKSKRKRAETVGQKEKYLFYQEADEEIADKNYEKYKYHIDGIVKNINKTLEYLKDLIERKKGLNENVIGQLLINLRYLTKHIAFKEEQECRMVKILNINDDKVKVENNRMYTNYEPNVFRCNEPPFVSYRMKKIYFGPKAKNMEFFQDILIKKKLNRHIPCEKSENPLA